MSAMRFLPGDGRKLAAALGADAAQRRRQAPRVVGAFEIAVHLAAQLALGDRVVGVAPDVDGAAGGAVHGHLPAAGVGAVVRADAGDDGDGGVGCGVAGSVWSWQRLLAGNVHTEDRFNHIGAAAPIMPWRRAKVDRTRHVARHSVMLVQPAQESIAEVSGNLVMERLMKRGL